MIIIIKCCMLECLLIEAVACEICLVLLNTQQFWFAGHVLLQSV